MINKSSTKKADFSRLIYENMLWRGLFLVSSLVLNICIARYYGAAASGWIFYVFSYYTLFIEVLGFSMETGISYYTAKNELPLPGLLGFSGALAVAAAVPVFIFFRLYLPEPLRGLPPGFVLFSAICYISGYILMNCCSALFYARKNFILPNLFSLCINGALIVLLLLSGKNTDPAIDHHFFIYMLFASFLVQGVLMFASVLLAPAGKPMLQLPNGEALKKIVRYSRQAFIANTVFFMLYRIDYWFVEKYCNPYDLGNYIQVSRLVQLFLVLPVMMAGVIFPATAGGEQAAINRSLKTMTASLLFLYAIVCGVLVLTGKWLFPFVFGASFYNMYGPFLLLIPGIFALSTLSLFAAYYAGKNRVRINVQGSLLALAVIITGDVLFIPAYGIMAAALVSSIGYMAYSIYVLMVFKKEYGLGWSYFLSVQKKDLGWIKDIVLANTFKRNQ